MQFQTALRSLPVPLLFLAGCAVAPTGAPDAAVAAPQAATKDWNQRVAPPVTQPTLFESPTIEAEARPIFMHQRLPETSIFGGGDFQLYALQLRVPVTDKIAIIATKDGYVDLNPGTGADTDGWADLAAGVKVVALDDEENNLLVTPGITYEADVGDNAVFQGTGDGVFRPFVSAAWEPAPEWNVLANVGFSLPSDGADKTHAIDYHAHVSYEVAEGVLPLIEVNGITYTRNANNLAAGFEGGDLINLGSNRVAGQTVITGALGARFQVSERVQIGVAYGVPLSARNDLFKDRVTIDASITF